MPYTDRIKSFILETFLFTDDPSVINDRESLLDRGVIDSTGVLELVMFLEEEFAISVRDDELIPDNLDSIERVNAFVKRKKS